MPFDDLLFSEDLFSGAFPDFNSQAFFNDYIFTGQYNSIAVIAAITYAREKLMVDRAKR